LESKEPKRRTWKGPSPPSIWISKASGLATLAFEGNWRKTREKEVGVVAGEEVVRGVSASETVGRGVSGRAGTELGGGMEWGEEIGLWGTGAALQFFQVEGWELTNIFPEVRAQARIPVRTMKRASQPGRHKGLGAEIFTH
jgi:hypothetical protein